MKLSNGSNRFAYNAQTVADDKEDIIVACEAIRQETDSGQLTPMIEAARGNLGVASLQTTTLADTGYGAGADIQAAAEKNLSVLVPPCEGKPAKDNPYASQHFHYDPVKRTVSCPRAEPLDYEGKTTKRGWIVERYRCHCRDCPVRRECTRDPKGRQIEIWPHTGTVQAMRARLAEAAVHQRWQRRGEIIERRFAQLKQHEGFRRWTVWGLENVRVQWSLLCASLNLRVIYRRWKDNQKAPATAAMTAIGQWRLVWLQTLWPTHRSKTFFSAFYVSSPLPSPSIYPL